MQSKEQNERHASRTRFIMALLEGRAQLERVAEARVPLKRAMTYRLLRAVRIRGKVALEDGRHGHPIKLRGATRQFLEEYCRETPHTPSCIVQTLLQERFDVSVSISQINRVRRQLGISNYPKNQKKPLGKEIPSSAPESIRKGQGVSCYWRLPIRQIYSSIWRQLSLRTCSPLIHRCVLRTSNPKRCVASC